jgi:hypothetical protein
MRRELPSVALLIDYDNLEIGASYDMPGRPLDLGCLIELCQRYGTVVVARAYADWGDPNERLAVYESGIEPCFAPIFRTTADQPGKSLADTVLVADGVDILWRIAPEFLVLVTSDKDILPLARLARLRGTRTIVVGSDRTAVPLRRLADEYVTYRDLVAGTGVPVATHQRAGLVPLSRGQSEPRGPRLLPEPRPATARPSVRRQPEPRRAPVIPAPGVSAPAAEALAANGPLAARPPAEAPPALEEVGAQPAAEAATAPRRRRRRRGGRGTGAGEPGVVAGVSVQEVEASLSESAEIEMGGPPEAALAEGDVLAEAAGAGASVLAEEAAAPPGATDAEALEEAVEVPPLSPPPPPRPLSPTGRIGFAAFGSFEEPTPAVQPPRAVEPEPIVPADADRAAAAVGPVEAPPLEAALDAAPLDAAREVPPPEAAAEPEAGAEEPKGETPAAAPARRRSRAASGRGRRAREHAEADVVATEGTPP